MIDNIGLNQIFPIYNENGTSFHDLVLRKGVVDSIVMSLGDKITGDVFYKDNTLQVTMKEYVEYNGIHYSLVNPPTIVREGMVADNGELKGMTKYSFEFYHPMCQLSNFPFTDVATKTGEEKYLSQNKTFSWIGKPQDYIDKLNKNLQGTVWYVRKSDRFPVEKDDELSDVQQFDNVSVAEAIKRGYEIWGIPYIVSQLPNTDPLYAQGKRFVVEYGLPSNEIYESESARQLDTPYVFQMGQGVGLKNNSRTPRNNKIVTRIAGYGSEDNVPYGYPQIVWTGNQDWDYTINNDPNNPLSYPIYKGIVGGQYVKLIKHPFTRTHLMPSIFTETVNKKVNPNAVGYDPTIEIKDYYDAVATQEYPYVNEINLQAPSYESHEFADIKPELDADRNTGIVSAVPLNADLTPADHWDDSMDDDGNYLQSYFQITLPRLSFDLYACAAITQEMEINMRSGACIGCTFPIQVDWDDYKKNFYDEDGNFVPDGEQRDLTKYPKSNLGQISVVVQKDNSTFGTLMPNIYQQPQANDLFVFIGISLPLSYIANAEERLDDAMKTYMLENNVYYFDYPLKFDEHFLATHTYILEQIRPNSIIHFDYGGVEQQLFVKQLTVKYGNAPLPQYDITLTDNIEVVLNQIGQVADDVEKLSSLIAILRQSYNRNVWNELAKKLSKTQDDTAQGFIRFMQGLQVGSQFVSGILGEGGVFRMNADGKVELVTDILYTRVKAYFDNVEIRDYQHTSGNRIASQAQGFKCSRVEWYDSNNNVLEQTIANRSNVAYFRCYWRVDDGQKKTDNQFIIGDLAFCQSAEVTNDSLVTNRFWRLVIGRNEGTTTTEDGEAWVDLSNAHNANGTPKMTTITWTGQGGTSQSMQALSFGAGSGIPTTEDDICQLGNVRDNTRQGAIIEYVSSIDSPTYQIFQDIGSDATNPYSLNGKNYIGLGYNTMTGRAYMNVYGDMFIGAKPDPQTGISPTYIEYKQDDGTQQHKPSLKIKANVEFTNPDSELDSFVQEHQNNYDDSWIQPALDAIQEQIDGELDTWYYEGVPTLNNLPASQWTTDDDKKKHVGDLYYDKATGFAYRFLYDDENESYYWTQIHDDAISEALRIANQAQDTADNKRRVFICDSSHKTPTPPYDKGDLWVNVKYPWATGATYNNEILKCTNAKTSVQSFAIGDWSVANGYTEALKNFVDNTYAPFVTNIQGQVDGKAETWRQATNPASAWTTDTEKAKHVGDLWMDISANGGNKTYIYVDNGASASIRYAWAAQEVPDAVFNKIDGKASIFVSQPSNYKANDLWILSADTTVNGVAYKQGEVLTSSSDSNSFVASHWTKKVRYTDDSAFNGYINAILNGTGSSGDAAVVAAAQKAIKDALGGGTIVDGGLLLTSLIAMRKKNQDNSYTTWAGISGMYQDNVLGGGLAAWYGGNMIDKETLTAQQIAQGWSTVRWAKSVDRFDGSGYRADGNITWNANGALTIKNITTLSDSNNNNILNELATFNSAFSFGTSGQGSTTALYITPKVPFQSLYIGTSDANKKAVATQEWVGQNYVSIVFFERLFQAYNGTTKVNTNSTSTIDNIKAMFGFWTEKYISALGKNDSGGGGGGDIDMTTVWSAMANNTNEQINLSHLTTALSGYATQSWVYQQLTGGTVTAVKVGTTTYSPTDGVVSLPAYPTVPTNVSSFTNDSGYITSSGDCHGATYLNLRGVSASDLASTTGCFAFSGYSIITPNYDYVGLQLDSGIDKFQLTAENNTLYFRQNDSGSSSTDWNPWVSFITSATIGSQSVNYATQSSSLYWYSGARINFDNVKSLHDSSVHYLIQGSGLRALHFSWDSYSYDTQIRIPDHVYQPADHLAWRSNGQNGVWENWMTILDSANIGDYNAGSATKLQTARTLWGQSFDGSGNVSGRLYMVASDVYWKESGYGDQFAIVPSFSGSDDKNILCFKSAVGASGTTPDLSTKMVITGLNGYVGIGTTEPAYKLDVQGTLGVNGTATIKSYIYVDRVPYGALSLGTQINILSARSKNAGTGNYASNVVISTFGSGETGTTVNNFPVRIGSQSGATWISAGDSGKTFSNQNTGICNTENLYLTADGSIAMYTGVANDSTNHSSKLAMFINTSCNVGIGTNSPSYKLHVAGVIYGSTGVFSNGYVSALGQNTSSDIRKKDIKENFVLSVEDVASAPSVKYLWKDDKDKGLQVGSIAQYWKNVLPEAVHEDNDGYLTMQYGVIALLSTISTARKVQDHERRIKELEKENERLRTEVEQLRLS